MYATRNARTKPTARPNKIPSGTEFTFRAKMPAATPAIRPFTVEPITMPTICARTAGVNHAVPPSTAPKIAPSKSPSSTLFIPRLRCLIFLSLSFTTNPRIPLTLSVHKKQNQDAHQQIGCNQQDEEAVAPVKAPGLLKDAFAMRGNRQAVQIAGDIERQLRNVRIAHTGRSCCGLCANGCKRFIDARSNWCRCLFRFPREQVAQKRTERIDVTARVQVRHVAARLFRGHISRRTHDRSVSCSHRNLGRIARIGGLLWFFENRCIRIDFARIAYNFFLQDFREAPVHHQNFAEGTDHDVRGFQIAVEDAARVRERDGIADAEKNSQTIRRRGDRLDVLVEAMALDKFHGVENAAVSECSDVMHGHDAGMLETREDARFADQAIGEISFGSREIENFQRDAPLKPLIFCGEHDTHAAARDAFEQAVVRAGEVGQIRAVAQAFECAVGKKFHFASQPKAARASRWNSSSLPQSSRRRSSSIFRNSRRAHASALVTSVKGMPY